MPEVFVGRVDEFQDRSRKLVSIGDGEIGVLMIDGRYYAWHNECAHAGGPVCKGRLIRQVEEPLEADKTTTMMRYKEGSLNLICPWHGYEYDVKTGINNADPRLRLRPAELRVCGDEIYVSV